MNHDTSRSAIENGPDIEEDDAEPGDVCEACDGDGGWTWTVEGPGGRDVDVDSECHRCDGTGWLP